MTLDSAALLPRLASLADSVGRPERIVIACSGGLDSVVATHCLAHCLASSPDWSNTHLLVMNVDHGLHADSAQWQAFCRDFAGQLDVAFTGVRVEVSTSTGHGPEAAAREARYGAFETELRSGDWLVTAHHQEDQAETLLINLLRGSGPAGLAGIAAERRLGRGWAIRPFLELSKRSIREYAEQHALQWVDDPSNQSLDFDRNFLRLEVLPSLTERWPAAARSMARSANLAGEAAELLQQLAKMDLAALGGQAARLPIAKLQQLGGSRQRNLLRFALRELALPPAPSRQLERIVSEVLVARGDAEPRVHWAGASARRYRDLLYLLADRTAETINEGPWTTATHDLGVELGSLELLGLGKQRAKETLAEHGLVIRARKGGEEIKPKGQAHTRKLKKLLQEDGVVPWMRELIPLIYRGADLIAVGDLWVSVDCGMEPDFAVRWNDRPALH